MERPGEKKLDKEEQMRKFLEKIIRKVAARPDLIVKTDLSPMERAQMLAKGQDPNDAWFYSTRIDLSTKKIVEEYVRIPESLMEKDEWSSWGKAAHEGGHVAITRLLAVKGADNRELGFQSMLASIEERPTDQVVRDRHFELGQFVDFARAESMSEGNDKRKGKISAPKFAQLCNLMVYEPHYDDLSEYDDEVLTMYEEIREDMNFIENSLPEIGASEEEVVEKQQLRVGTAITRIWPKVKHLAEEDFTGEMLKQMINQALNGSIDLGINDSDEGAEPSFRIKLPPDLAEELAKISKPMKSGKNIEDLPLIEASPTLIEALKNALNKLPEELKKKLGEKAREKLDEIEDELVKKHSGKLIERPKTNHEIKEEEERRAEEDNKIKKEIEKVRRAQAVLLSKKSEYERAYDEIRIEEQKLYRDLSDILNPQVKRKIKLKSVGNKINLPAVFKWEAARSAGKTPDTKIFESVDKPDKKNYAFTLLVDLSGSMAGEKIEETFKAIVLLSEVLNRLGIEFEVLGFQDEVIVFKRFEEKLSDGLRKKISGMPGEVQNRNPGGHNKAGYNDDGPCLEEASNGISKRRAKDKFLIVLSDGEPCGRRSSSSDLIKAVEKIEKAGKINLIGLGLGKGTDHVKRFYPISFPNLNIENLGDELSKILEDIILNPSKYR
jgi:hypothetical protein